VNYVNTDTGPTAGASPANTRHPETLSAGALDAGPVQGRIPPAKGSRLEPLNQTGGAAAESPLPLERGWGKGKLQTGFVAGRVEFAQLWVWLSVFLVATGWVLSALGALNAFGYLALLGLGVAGLVVARRRSGATGWNLTRIRWRRFRKLLPLGFLALAGLALVGGMLYAPNNYDGLSYRLPRVLHWLTEGRWHWIHTHDARLNTRACGFEWLTVPLLLFFHTDRLLFLINFVSYLLLPGLVFQLLSGLGVRRRVAWHWMWIVPSGYCFVLQAGSISNDAFATIYGLAAMVFALRARRTREVADAWLALLAAGLLTGAKASNLPLLLPIGLALLPSLGRLVLHPLRSLAGALLAALVSFVPTALLNLKHCGDWSGGRLEDPLFRMSNPLMGIIGNTVQLAMQNFVLPLFPWARAWNSHTQAWWPGWLVGLFKRYFEAGALSVGEIPVEELAGLGFGVSWLLLVSVVAGVCYARRRRAARSGAPVVPTHGFSRLLLVAPYLALLAYMASVGLSAACRLVAPYYAFLLPLLLVGGAQGVVIRQRWWRTTSAVIMALALAVVALTPARPLWPALLVTRQLHQWRPDNALLGRAERVYSFYAERSNAFGPLRSLMPPTEAVVGMVSKANDPVTSLWKPLGQRRIVYFLPEDSVSELRARGVHYVVLSPEGLDGLFSMTAAQWMNKFDAELVGQAEIRRMVSNGPEQWSLVKLRTPERVRLGHSNDGPPTR
jgi:hypothetical protein